MFRYLEYPIFPMYSDSQTWANSVDLDQKPQNAAGVYTVCHLSSRVYTYQQVAKGTYSNFRTSILKRTHLCQVDFAILMHLRSFANSRVSGYVFSSPELCSGWAVVITFRPLSVRLSVNIFKSLLFWSPWANFAQISYGISLGWGGTKNC